MSLFSLSGMMALLTPGNYFPMFFGRQRLLMSPFGRVQFVLVSSDMYCHLVYASAHMEEAVKCLIAHYLVPLAAMSLPQHLRTNDATSHTSAFENVCAPYNSSQRGRS